LREGEDGGCYAGPFCDGGLRDAEGFDHFGLDRVSEEGEGRRGTNEVGEDGGHGDGLGEAAYCCGR
jgi:hypothetical protein